MPAVGGGPELQAVSDADRPTEVVYTLATADPFRFSATEYLGDYTSDRSRDEPLVDTWGLIGGSLRAWRAVDGNDPALWMGLMVLEFPTPDAAAGAFSHLAARGRGAVDSITRFEVPGVDGALGLSYVEYPRSDGAPLPGESVVFQRGRHVATVMTSGNQPADRRSSLEAVARQVEPGVAALG
jgi:hypothetical protein